MKSLKTQIYTLIGLSLFLGMYIAFYLSYISSLFLKTTGASYLPLSYIIAGLFGAALTKWFQTFEIKKGFFSAALFILFGILISVFSLWYYFDLTDGKEPWVIFGAYAWFWVSGNFLVFVFWKLPPLLFDLGQNQKYNAVISAGEVISSVVCYGSIPVLLRFNLVKNPSFLMLLAGIAAFGFILVLFSLSRNTPKPSVKKSSQEIVDNRFIRLIKNPFFLFLFLAIIASFVVRFLVDYLALLSSEKLFSTTADLAGFLAILFGSAKLLELFLKLFLAKRLLKIYGIQAGLLVLIFVLLLTTSSGLLLLLLGATSIGLIFAILNKLLERSVSNAIYTTSQNMLYQAFPHELKGSVQNYADGYGKTYGQLIAGLLLLLIIQFQSVNLEITFLFTFLIASLIAWWLISNKLIFHYKTNLANRLLKPNQSQKYTSKNILSEDKEKLSLSIKNYLQLISAREDLKNPEYSEVTLYLESPIKEALILVFEQLRNIYPNQPIEALQTQFFSGENKDEVIAIEYFDLILSPNEKSIFLPLLKESNPQKLLRKFEEIFPILIFPPDLRLMDLVNNIHLNIDLRKAALNVFAKNFGNKHQLLASTCFNPHPTLMKLALQYLEKKDPIGFIDIKSRIQKQSLSH